MFVKIDQDHSRFKQIVRGRIRKSLRQFMSQGELIGKQGKKLVSIPVPYIDIPHFRFETRQKGGVGQGEGDVGATIGTGEGEGDGHVAAGDAPRAPIFKIDVSLY